VTGLSPRVLAALVLLLVTVLLPLRITGAWIAALLASRPSPDALTEHDRRLAPVRDALVASGATQVGYLPRTALRAHLDRLTSDPHYLATRYALAPILVLPTTSATVVFADLGAESDPSGAIPGELEVLRRFDDRLVLLRWKVQ